MHVTRRARRVAGAALALLFLTLGSGAFVLGMRWPESVWPTLAPLFWVAASVGLLVAGWAYLSPDTTPPLRRP